MLILSGKAYRVGPGMNGKYHGETLHSEGKQGISFPGDWDGPMQRHWGLGQRLKVPAPSSQPASKLNPFLLILSL